MWGLNNPHLFKKKGINMDTKLTEMQEKIQQNRKQIRMDDYINLRKLINQKLIWITEEKKKANEFINQYKEKINQINISILKLDGAQSALNSVLNNENNKEQ